jgi:hypothetical protein
MAIAETASCFQLGVRFPDGTLQTTAVTTAPPTPPAGVNGAIQFNNGGVFGGELVVPLAASLSAASVLPNGTTATTQAMRDYSSSIATTAYVDQMFDPTKAVTLFDDFMSGTNATGSVGSLGWEFTGTGGILTNPNPNSSGTLGEVLATSGGTNTNPFLVYLSYITTVPPADNPGWNSQIFDMRWRIKLAKTTSVAYFFGLESGGLAEATATDFIAIAYNTGASDTGFTLITKTSSGARNAVSIGVSADTSYHTLRLRGDGTGRVYASVDGGTEVSTTTSVPSAALIPASCVTTLTNATAAFRLDYWWMFMELAR